jgi:translation elongation factor EF-G
MANFKKFMVVPYVYKIEKPSDSFIENAEKNMSEIIENSEIADDLKMKLYHKNLNKFLLKYDPKTYGVTPVIAKLASKCNKFYRKKHKGK